MNFHGVARATAVIAMATIIATYDAVIVVAMVGIIVMATVISMTTLEPNQV